MNPGILSVHRVKNRLCSHAALLSEIHNITLGKWFNVYGTSPLTLEVKGIQNATVRIFGSVSNLEPIDDGIQVGKDIKEDLLMVLEPPMHWIRATVPVYISGNISCNLFGSDLGG